MSEPKKRPRRRKITLTVEGDALERLSTAYAQLGGRSFAAVAEYGLKVGLVHLFRLGIVSDPETLKAAPVEEIQPGKIVPFSTGT